MKHFLKAFICLSLAAPVVSSCYDDSALWDKVTDIENRVYELELEMTSQAEALNQLLTNGATLTSCKKNSDGSYTVTLSDGTKFNVLPEGTDFSTLVTYTVVGGKNCWATYDSTGQAVAITDASGNAIPVSNEISVKIKDGVYVLVINGKEYETGYDAEDLVQVFSSCTPLEDASGNIYAVRFTLGEGMEITVALDGYKGVIFKLSNVNNTVVSEYYVDYGASQSFLMEMTGVVDYVMQVPDGWRVKEVSEELTGETYLHVTAPAEETVALGAAVAEGDLKIVSVVEGGNAAVSKIYLSTDPFKTYDVSALKAVVEPYTGIQKFVYGMALFHEFDESSIISKVNEILAFSAELPKGYFISEDGINTSYEKLLGEEFAEDNQYVFWAVPALYREETEGVKAGFYAEQDMLRYFNLSPMSAKISISDITLLDAKAEVSVKGALSMYCGVSPLTDDLFEEIVYQINNGIAEPVEDALSYSGLASAFPSGEETMVYMYPDTKYVIWVVPIDPTKVSYTTADIVYETFATKSVTAGGEIEVEVGEFKTTASSISTTVKSPDAAMIYYAYLQGSDGERYSTSSNEVKMSKLMAETSFAEVRGSSAEAVIESLHPDCTKWLYAVAIGNDGLYGDVVCKSAKTGSVSFNDLSLTVSEVIVKADEATMNVAVSGGTATDFIYWVGYAKDPFWVGSDYCNNSKTTAQKYLAANPDAEQVVAAMKHNGAIAEDGNITVKDLSMSTDYVFIVLAKDESGNYSKAGYKKFTTLAADLGEMVLSDNTKWTETKQYIMDNLVWHEDIFTIGSVYATYSFDVKIPTDLTAYISCFGTGATQMTEIIVEVEEYASRMTTASRVVYDEDGNQPRHPDWYDDYGKLIEGSLVNVYTMYPHGGAPLGAVTYFSSNGHVGCIGDAEGQCSHYEYYMARLAEYCSLDYWRQYVIDNGTYHYNNDPTHPYSRTLTDPDKIEDLAQKYLDIYYEYYKDEKPILYVNDGSALTVENHYASGLDENGNVMDKVTIVLKDNDGNYYEPIYIDVPNYFK